jgi:hypothetical protein
MGATTFSTYGLGKTAGDAFYAAQDRARYEYGHGGYTGTIAEKSGYVLFAIPNGSRCSAQRFLNLMDEMEDFQSIEYLKEDLKYSRNKTDLRQREAGVKKEERRQASFFRKNAGMEGFLQDAHRVYREKWDNCVALEVKGAKAIAIKKAMGRSGTHDKVFLFCGWASC